MLETLLDFSAIFAAIIVAGVGLWWNLLNARQLRKQPFLEKQLVLCLEASNVAATLATTASVEAFDCAHSRFLELFWGPLSVVENDRVSIGMIKFRKKLVKLIEKGAPSPLSGLQADSYDLAKEVRKLVLRAWQIETLEAVLNVEKG